MEVSFYGDIFIDIKSLRKMLQELSYFTKGLKILLVVDGKKETFLSNNGLIDGLSSEDALSRPFSYFYETNDCKVELALQWVSKKGNIKGYANGLYMPDGGAFISGFKSSLTRTFNSLSKDSKSIKCSRYGANGDISSTCSVVAASLLSPSLSVFSSTTVVLVIPSKSLVFPVIFPRITSKIIGNQ